MRPARAMSFHQGENDNTVTVLAAADAVLESIPAVPTAGSCPRESDGDHKNDGFTPVVDRFATDESAHLMALVSRLGDQLRANALNMERQISSRGYVTLFSVEAGRGAYRFSSGLYLGVHGEVQRVVGAQIGDSEPPIVVDPEDPLILEVLAGDMERTLTDRVRILSQLVCLYCDAIRFGGFHECPVGDAVRLLRCAVGELRDGESTYAYECADDGEDGGQIHSGDSTGEAGEWV